MYLFYTDNNKSFLNGPHTFFCSLREPLSCSIDHQTVHCHYVDTLEAYGFVVLSVGLHSALSTPKPSQSKLKLPLPFQMSLSQVVNI